MQETEVAQAESFNNDNTLSREWNNVLEQIDLIMICNFIIMDAYTLDLKADTEEGSEAG